jgi:hypothetical protein
MNPNSILLLYEGDTEEEFYKSIIAIKIPKRKIRITYDNLKGITTNINRKVLNKVYKHLSNNESEGKINVFVAIDREGDRTNESPLDIPKLKATIAQETNRIAEVIEIIATQDIESWFLIDIEGIYTFLKVPVAHRNTNKFKNTEAFNNRSLSNLFRTHNRVYFKGRRVAGLIDQLDINKIYEDCQDLREGIEKMLSLIK